MILLVISLFFPFYFSSHEREDNFCANMLFSSLPASRPNLNHPEGLIPDHTKF